MPELQAVFEIIKNLEPKPGPQATRASAPSTSSRTSFVRKIDGEYVIQLSEDGLPKLRISAPTAACSAAATARSAAEASEYLKDKMRSAIWLIKCLDQRQRTIYKVAESIVRHQRDFLDRGIEHLRPLVLRDVANDIGMHESTVSRVVSNKYMHTPRGLFPMKYFFHSGIDSSEGDDVSSLSIKNKISNMHLGRGPEEAALGRTLMQKLRSRGNPDRPPDRREVPRRVEASRPLPAQKPSSDLRALKGGAPWPSNHGPAHRSHAVARSTAEERLTRMERHPGDRRGRSSWSCPRKSTGCAPR